MSQTAQEVKPLTLEGMFGNLLQSIESRFCRSHQEWKQEIYNDGDPHCESCVYEQFHYLDEGLEDEVSYV